MNEKDLEKLIAAYQKESPSDLQIHRWKKGVQSQLNTSLGRPQRPLWAHWIAASMVGFLLGGMVAYQASPRSKLGFLMASKAQTAQNNVDDATIERVYTNTYE